MEPFKLERNIMAVVDTVVTVATTVAIGVFIAGILFFACTADAHEPGGNHNIRHMEVTLALAECAGRAAVAASELRLDRAEGPSYDLYFARIYGACREPIRRQASHFVGRN